MALLRSRAIGFCTGRFPSYLHLTEAQIKRSKTSPNPIGYVPVAPGFPIGHMICSRFNCDCVGHKCVNIEFANFTIQRLTLLLLLKDIVGDN